MQEVQSSMSSLSITENPEILVLYNPKNLIHKSSKKHPQCPQRIETILAHLKTITLPTNIKINQSKEDHQELVKKIITKVHGENYHEFVAEMWHDGIKKSEMFINIDTYFMKDTYVAAVSACQTIIQGIDKLLRTKFNTFVGIVRPPGHHSGMKSQPHGFCFFNNVAIGTTYALTKIKKKKIAIIDWDVHHGQGTQKIFYESNEVLYISIHRFDQGLYFPHMKESSSSFVGSGKGQGFNINICWDLPNKKKGENYQRQQTCGNSQYIQCFNRIILPILRQFDPEMIFISCGFDSAEGDIIGQMKLDKIGYSWMTTELMKLQKKMAVILEGGYNLDTLKWASETVLLALSNQLPKAVLKQLQTIGKQGIKANEIGLKGIQQSIKIHSKYWKIN